MKNVLNKVLLHCPRYIRPAYRHWVLEYRKVAHHTENPINRQTSKTNRISFRYEYTRASFKPKVTIL